MGITNIKYPPHTGIKTQQWHDQRVWWVALIKGVRKQKTEKKNSSKLGRIHHPPNPKITGSKRASILTGLCSSVWFVNGKRKRLQPEEMRTSSTPHA
jgi:hypothetical protein